MEKSMRHIILALVAIMSLHAWADTTNDTVYFYSTWEQMVDMDPSAFIVNPVVEAYNDCQLYFNTSDRDIDKTINRDFIAASFGENFWFINSNYLRKCFAGEAERMKGFIPLYFNEKVAYVTYMNKLTVKDLLMGNGYDGVTGTVIDYYYINFLDKRIERVTHNYLSQLLDNYHDLLMRYEGMRDYKKSYMIEDYFFKFIDRYTEDPMTPYIVDLVDNSWNSGDSE